jgi:NADH dehydrogenase
MSVVFITGGAGFVGRSVITALLARGHSIHALVKNRPLNISSDRVKSFTGDLFDDAVLDAAMAGCDSVIHLVGIIVEKPGKGITFDRIHHQGTAKVVEATKRAGIRRYVHMSALGAAVDSKSAYLRTKYLAEEYVRGSGLDWTIIEPSLIYGPGGDFTKMESGWARGTAFPFVVMPYFGSGLLGRDAPRKIQPVFVEDVARAFAESLENARTIGQVFPMGGPEQMTWPEMHRTFSRVLAGKEKPALAVPAWYAKAITHVVPASLLPFTRDQVLMSETDNVCDMSGFAGVFGWAPSLVLSAAVLRVVEGSSQ